MKVAKNMGGLFSICDSPDFDIDEDTGTDKDEPVNSHDDISLSIKVDLLFLIL